jgi:HK97 family phage major capsid protein
MKSDTAKYKEAVAEEFHNRIKAFDFSVIEKVRKAKEENGTFDVIVSTEDVDRAGEIVRQDGWDLTNYKNNPVVLWGHDYYNMPIGICTETYKTTVRGVPALGAKGVFFPADINPLAQQVRRMYEYGLKTGYNVGCTTSVGFIPKEFDHDSGNVITKAELLEFSFVPVPANEGVGPAEGRALTVDEARTLGLDLNVMRVKGIEFASIRGFVPDVGTSTKKAANSAAWKTPKYEDYYEKAWNDLSGAEKEIIAGYFAYVKSGATPSEFSDLKFPHHRASDGAVVFNGLKAAMEELLENKELPESDRKAAYEHLAEHYKLFEKKAPEYSKLKEAEAGDHCQMDDGSPGILSHDPKDPDGPLVCVPQEQDKSADQEHGSQKELLKDIGNEHTRHQGEVEKAFDTYEDSQKSLFADTVRAATGYAISTKANEALIEEQDNRGGYLVQREIADAIMRIAASVGTILSQAAKWEMKGDQLAVPNYTGSFLKGGYIGVDAPGPVTGITFGQAQLIVKKWQLAFVVGNDLIADASVNVADWLLALGGESLANMIDYQGFVGGASTGDPFLGILNMSSTTTVDETGTKVTSYVLPTGSTTFSKFAVLDDASAMIGDLEESILDGAAFYMNRTVWAKLRTQKDTAGNYILPFAGAANKGEPAVDQFPGGGPIKPAGEILGYPVYTNRWLPAVGASSVNGFSDAVSNQFLIFGNMKAFAFGDKGEMRVAQFTSGSFGGKEVALSDQTGIIYKHRHALALTLPRAMVVAKTAAS